MAKYCLPIISESLETVRQVIEKNLFDFDLFEVWLDYVDSPSIEALEQLVEKYPDKLIFLFRRLGLEPIVMPVAERIKISHALGAKKCYFDFDIRDQKAEIDALLEAVDNGMPQRTILSYHNYSETPDTDELLAILDEMQKKGATVSKLACMCNSTKDTARLMQILAEKKKERKVIILGMGVAALALRVFGVEWGNEFTFCPIDRKAQTAFGQLTRSELSSLEEILENARK